jgi:hypothetical protein
MSLALFFGYMFLKQNLSGTSEMLLHFGVVGNHKEG